MIQLQLHDQNSFNVQYFNKIKLSFDEKRDF